MSVAILSTKEINQDAFLKPFCQYNSGSSRATSFLFCFVHYYNITSAAIIFLVYLLFSLCNLAQKC